MRFDFDFFSIQFIYFVKRKINSTIEQLNCKGHEKRDQFLVSKAEIHFRYLSKLKSFLIDPIFSHPVHFIKKRELLIVLNFKKISGHLFFLRNSKLTLFSNK